MFRSCRLPLMSPSAHVAFRSCRLPLMSPSAHVAFRVIKALGSFGLLFCLLVLLPMPSWAGQWYITYSQSGIWSEDGSLNGVWDTLTPPYNTFGGYDMNTIAGMDASTTGTVVATATWVPDYGQTLATDPPPARLLLLETASAAWYGSAGPPSGDLGVADDGLGDPMITSLDTNSADNPSLCTGGGDSSGSHLIQLDGSSGVVTLSCTLLASCPSAAWMPGTDSSPGYWVWGWADCTAQFKVVPDTRAVTILRDGAHNETVGSDGTVHGDTTYSYNTGSGPVQNIQVFHPNFAGGWSPNPNYISTGTGPLDNISWQWSPQNQAAGQADTWQDHRQNIDIGTLFPEGSPQQWFGPADAVKAITISYTATDLNPNTSATAIGTYDLRVHDQYDNWRRVDAQGTSMSLSAAGDPGSLDQLGQTTTPLPATPVLTIHDAGVDWNVVGDTGGGALSGTSILLMTLPDPPTWPATALALAGLTVQTISALPTDPHQVSPPSGVTFDASALQTAYQNYVYDKTAQPGEEINSNLVDTNFALSLANNPDFQGYDNGNYGTVSVTATVYQQTLDYYFYADEYDTGGLVTHTAPSTVHKPGGYVWNYLWTYAGTITPPSNPTT